MSDDIYNYYINCEKLIDLNKDLYSNKFNFECISNLITEFEKSIKTNSSKNLINEYKLSVNSDNNTNISDCTLTNNLYDLNNDSTNNDLINDDLINKNDTQNYTKNDINKYNIERIYIEMLFLFRKNKLNLIDFPSINKIGELYYNLPIHLQNTRMFYLIYSKLHLYDNNIYDK